MRETADDREKNRKFDASKHTLCQVQWSSQWGMWWAIAWHQSKKADEPDTVSPSFRSRGRRRGV